MRAVATGVLPVTTDRAEHAIVVEDVALPEAAPPHGRPRLSQTITLGQGAEQPYTPPAPRPAAPPGPSVVVNNNSTVVVQPAPVYGFGYGGYYGRGGYGPTVSPSNSGGLGAPRWGSSGWEGPQRTAAPGQTPGIGGNWAPAPSYGPAPMR